MSYLFYNLLIKQKQQTKKIISIHQLYHILNELSTKFNNNLKYFNVYRFYFLSGFVSSAIDVARPASP